MTGIVPKDGLSYDEFIHLWHTEHRVVALETQSTFAYVRNEIVRALTPGRAAVGRAWWRRAFRSKRSPIRRSGMRRWARPSASKQNRRRMMRELPRLPRARPRRIAPDERVRVLSGLAERRAFV